MALLDSQRPARRLRPAVRGVTGKVAMPDGSSAGHESSLERDWLICLGMDRRISQLRRMERVLEQPFTLYYDLDGKQRRYTPDIQADFSSGSKRWSEVYEVKYRDDLKANWQKYKPRFKAAVGLCRAQGWRFRIITEQHVRGPLLENFRFLRRYATSPQQAAHAQVLMKTLRALGPTDPKTLLAAAWFDTEMQMAALAELWRLVALGAIQTDLNKPLTMRSQLWEGGP